MQKKNSKKTIRNHILMRRKLLSDQSQRTAQKKLQRRISKLRIIAKASSIGIYFSHGGEINLAELTKWAWKEKKKVFLPVVIDNITIDKTERDKIASKKLSNEKQSLKFNLYTPNTRLKKNRYGIPEPKILNTKHISLRQLDLIFIPLVAFTTKGKRVGMGGGYYDRAFQFKRKFRFLRPKIIGVGYDWQRVDDFSDDPWDVRLDSVLTDQRAY